MNGIYFLMLLVTGSVAFLGSITNHPTFLTVLGFLITGAIGFIIKKIVELVKTASDIHDNQKYVMETLPTLINGQASLNTKVTVVSTDLSTLSTDLRSHMDGEENVVTDILTAVASLGEKLDHQTLVQARNAFRHSAFYSDIAFCDFSLIKNEWEFRWGNESFFTLTGLSLAQAKADLFWELNVLPKEKTYFRRTVIEQANRGESIDVTYEHVKPDGTHVDVRLSAVPSFNLDGVPVAYFVAMKTQDLRAGLGKGPDHRT